MRVILELITLIFWVMLGVGLGTAGVTTNMWQYWVIMLSVFAIAIMRIVIGNL